MSRSRKIKKDNKEKSKINSTYGVLKISQRPAVHLGKRICILQQS